MKVKYVSILAIVLVISGGIPLMSAGSISNASAKYTTHTQTQANSNDCNTGTNCSITSPQTQGDGTANSPINTQITGFNEEPEDGVGVGIDFTLDNCMSAGTPRLPAVRCNIVGFPERTVLSCNANSGPIVTCSLITTVSEVLRCSPPPIPNGGRQMIHCETR
jgi:hypothetical protein